MINPTVLRKDENRADLDSISRLRIFRDVCMYTLRTRYSSVMHNGSNIIIHFFILQSRSTWTSALVISIRVQHSVLFGHFTGKTLTVNKEKDGRRKRLVNNLNILAESTLHISRFQSYSGSI